VTTTEEKTVSNGIRDGSNMIDVAISAGVATVTLRGEKSVNVMGRSLVASLVQTLEALRTDDALRLVILTGPQGGSFQGGVNIAEMAGFTPDTARDFITLLHQACHGLRMLPVPSIARIEGFCLGGGMEIAAACDLRVGAESSRYGMPEVQVGLPSVIEARLLPTLIGWGKTRELLYRGNIIDSLEAHRLGFLQKVVHDHKIDSEMQPWIDDILRAEPNAIRTQKRLIENWLETPPAVGIQASIDAFSATFHADAPNKRLSAFLNRPRTKK
jgi:enoyl-CoA hydratase/carnithine racemase